MNLTSEQKQVVKHLYKHGGKIEKSNSHINFLSNCLKAKVIPSNFKLKNTLPGNRNANQEKLNQVSFESMNDEKQKHVNTLIGARKAFENGRVQLEKVFIGEKVVSEMTNIQKHLGKIRRAIQKKKMKFFL